MMQKCTQTINRIAQSRFSTSPILLKDWQYVAKINNNLKQGDINEAIKCLINSHLDKQVLDMQTFRNMHYKMKELNAEPSYQELTYKIYREYFKPHILMLEWMNSLTSSKDQKTQAILEQDYKALNVAMPTDQQVSDSKNSQNQEQGISNSTAEQKNEKKSAAKIEEAKAVAYDEQHELKQSNENEGVKKLIEVLLGKCGNIVLHDVEVHYENPMEAAADLDYDKYFENEHDQAEEVNEEEEEEEENDDLDLTIKMIKIGRIQIFDKSSSTKDKNPA